MKNAYREVLCLALSVFFVSHANAYSAGGGDDCGVGSNVAIGDSAETDCENVTVQAIAIGNNAFSVDSGTAIGAFSRVETPEGMSTNAGVALGYNALTTGESAVSIGFYAEATGTSALALGQSANASGSSSMAFGDSSQASGQESIALGRGSVASGGRSSSIGTGSNATGLYSYALGAYAKANAENSYAFGFFAENNVANTAEFAGLRITGLADGVNDQDAVTVKQLNNAINGIGGGGTTVDMDYDYVDDGDSRTLVNAQEHADDGDVRTLASANLYTDAGIIAAEERATSYTDQVATKTLNSANAYTDVRAYEAEESAVARSNAYTDVRIGELENRMSSGIAAMAAMPDMPALPVGGWGVGIGTGHYNGQSALGFKAGFSPRRNMTFQFGGGIPGNGGSGGAVISTGFSMAFD